MQNFNSEIVNIESCLANNSLPGLSSQLKMAPVTRLTEHAKSRFLSGRVSLHGDNPKKSAVLVLFYPKNNHTHLVMIKRSTDNSVHSAQISFPGGKAEKTDRSLIHTALREANEEIGVVSDSIVIIGNLTKLYIPPSNFDVYPIVGVTYSTPIFISNNEVQKILEVDLNSLINPKTCTYKQIQYRTGNEFVVPCYYIQGEVIWGATAMIVAELLDVIKARGKFAR